MARIIFANPVHKTNTLHPFLRLLHDSVYIYTHVSAAPYILYVIARSSATLPLFLSCVYIYIYNDSASTRTDRRDRESSNAVNSLLPCAHTHTHAPHCSPLYAMISSRIYNNVDCDGGPHCLISDGWSRRKNTGTNMEEAALTATTTTTTT